MNKLVIPPSPNWYENYPLACASDNTIIYGSRNEIIVINPKPPEEPADVKLIAGIHTQRVICVVVNPQWGNPDKLAVSVAADNVVRLLDIETCTSKLAHVGHTTRSDKVVGATFAGNDKVVSVSEDGFIIIWRLCANHLTSLTDIVGTSRNKVSCISSNPHAPWMIAFGFKKGAIVVTDLRKTGKVLYRLTGHEAGPIISLSWCPTPYNIFPKKIKKVKEIKNETLKSLSAETKVVINSNITEKLDEISAEASISNNPSLNQVESSKSEQSTSSCKEASISNIPSLDQVESSKSEQSTSSCKEASISNIPSLDQVESSKTEQSTSSCKEASVSNNPSLDQVESSKNEQSTSVYKDASEQKADDVVEIDTNKHCEENSDSANKKEPENPDKDEHLSRDKIEVTITVAKERSRFNDQCHQYMFKDTGEGSGGTAVSVDGEKGQGDLRQNAVDDNEEIQAADLEQGMVDNIENPVKETEEGQLNLKQNQENTDEVTQIVSLEENQVLDDLGKDADKKSGDNIQNLKQNHENTDEGTQIVSLEAKQVLDDLGKDADKKSGDNIQNLKQNQENTDADKESGDNIQNLSPDKMQVSEVDHQSVGSHNEDTESMLDIPLKEETLPQTDDESQLENVIQDDDDYIDPVMETREFLLASTARGLGTIKIWRAGTDGLLQTELHVPARRGRQKSGKMEDKSWITVCWVTPKDLLSSSHRGELLHWKLPIDALKGGKANKSRVIHDDHHKHLFCIAAPVRRYASVNDEDWRDRNLLNAWTTGKDRFLLNTSLCADHKTLASYPTIGGNITCLAASPIDPTRIAVASGDGTCRMWDLSRPHLQRITMPQLCDRTQIKIASLAWHPVKEVTLAFGTADGRIGFLDTSNTSKAPTFLVQASSGPVYRIEWGHSKEDSEHLGLYAVASGNLMAYDISKPLNEPTKFDFVESCVTHFTWKRDYSILAVGTKTGDVLLYSKELKLITKFLLQNKAVRWMTWHPEGTLENWLAVSTNNVFVYDCSAVSKDSVGQNQASNYEECTIAIFTDHTHYVQCLAWSPHKGGILASASEDGSALVWDVKTKTLLHSLMSLNFDMINTIIWSPLDPDYVITGGRDCMIQIWKLSENPPQQKINKKQRVKVLKLEEEQVIAKEENVVEVKKIDTPPKTSRKYLLAGIAQTQNPNFQNALLEDCERLFALCYEKIENGKHNEEENSDEREMKFDALQLFGDKEDMNHILYLEKTGRNRTQHLYTESISMWQGDIGDTIKDAINSGNLNRLLVAAAPMVSFNLWQEACEAYAKQISEKSDSLCVEAAYFYLACHKVEEAINVLCHGSHFREALAVAKCRLQPTDPLINTIFDHWATFCMAVGNFETAAQCFIATGKLEEATKILFRRSDVPTLKFCLKLAQQCDNKDLVDAVMYRLNAFMACDVKESEESSLQLLPRVQVELKNNEQNSSDHEDIDLENEKTATVKQNLAADSQCVMTMLHTEQDTHSIKENDSQLKLQNNEQNSGGREGNMCGGDVTNGEDKNLENEKCTTIEQNLAGDGQCIMTMLDLHTEQDTDNTKENNVVPESHEED